MSKELKDITINMRDGINLVIKGIALSAIDNQHISGKEQNRWDEYTLYKTQSGKYVIYHEYNTMWQGEVSHDDYTVVDNIEALKVYVIEEQQPLLYHLLREANIPIIITEE